MTLSLPTSVQGVGATVATVAEALLGSTTFASGTAVGGLVGGIIGGWAGEEAVKKTGGDEVFADIAETGWGKAKGLFG